MNKKQMEAEEREWRARDDLRTLIEAEKIRGDKARLKAAMAEHKKQKAALENLET